MSEREIRRLLREICDELDARVGGPARRVLVSAAIGTTMALSGCGGSSDNLKPAAPQPVQVEEKTADWEEDLETGEEEAKEEEVVEEVVEEVDREEDGETKVDRKIKRKRPREPQPILLYGVY